MSSLSVKNSVLRYKGISYQISQITSIKVVEIKNKNNFSFQFLKYTSVPFFISSGLSWIIFSMDYLYGLNLSEYRYYGVILSIVALLLLIFSVKKIIFIIKNKFNYMYGLSLRISNGDDPIFMTSNKDLLFSIESAIHDSMDSKGGESVIFDNVNIEIKDAGNVEVGNIVRR